MSSKTTSKNNSKIIHIRIRANLFWLGKIWTEAQSKDASPSIAYSISKILDERQRNLNLKGKKDYLDGTMNYTLNVTEFIQDFSLE